MLNNLSPFLLVGLGGFLGSIVRFAASSFLPRLLPFSLPVGTLFVNMTGSFFLGWLMGGHFTEKELLFLGTGVLGAFTTFSTFQLEVFQFIVKQQRALFILYTILTYAGGIWLFLGGWSIGMRAP